MLHNSAGASASNTLNLQLRLTNYFQISACDPKTCDLFEEDDLTPEDFIFYTILFLHLLIFIDFMGNQNGLAIPKTF